MARLKIQIGVEDKDSKLRLTPIDTLLPDMPDHVEALLASVILAADARDPQPGDGEVDVKLTEPLKKALSGHESLARLIPKDATAFIRITVV